MATPKLALIPTGYKAGKVYSVLPESGVGDFTFTRASEATRINSAGLLEVEATGVPRLEYPLIDGVVNGCPSLLLENQATNLITYPISFGNSYWTKSGASIEGDPSTAGVEKVVNGDFTTDSDWTKATGATISGGTLNFSGVANGDSGTNQASSIVVGKTYKATFTVSNWVAGGVRILIGSTGTSATRSLNGTFTAYVVASGNTTIYLQSIGVTTLSIDNVSVKEVQGYSSPSVDFPTSAFKLVEDTSTGQHEMRGDNNSVSTTEPYSYSFYAKYGGRRYIGIKALNAESTYCYFDILNKLVVSSGAYTCSIDELTNGWMRINVVIPNTLSAASVSVRYYLSDDGLTISYTGDGTSGVYLFMAQAEQGSYATSPTLTSLTAEGTTTTRVAETCTGAGDASTFNDSEGVLMAEISALADNSGGKWISLSNGSTSQRISFANENGNIRVYIFNGGIIWDYIYNNINTMTFNKISLKYKSGDYSLFINGFEVNASTASSIVSGINSLQFDSGGGGSDFYGKTKQIQYFNTVLTSADLETLTSWTSFISMANAQNYNII